MSMAPFISLAILDYGWDKTSGPWYYFGASREFFIVLAAGAGAAVLAIIWVLVFYSGRRHRRHRHHHSRHQFERQPESRASNGQRVDLATDPAPVRRWRRRRREHRPRNPTLAETRGLPPLRAEQPPDPSP